MILPPFFGYPISYNDREPYRLHYSYLGEDVHTYRTPTKSSINSYLSLDAITYKKLPSIISNSYLSVDTITYSPVNTLLKYSYLSVDVLTYRPPAIPPNAPFNILATDGDTFSDLSWSAPNNNGSSITDYIIQYSLANNNYILSTENGYSLFTENNIDLNTENTIEFSYSWTVYPDGTNNSTSHTATGLTNNMSYLFRIAAVNNAGTGVYGYSNITTPIGNNTTYSSMLLYLPLNNDFNDVSCDTKLVNYVSSKIDSIYLSTTEQKYGNGSLFLSGEASNEQYSVMTVPHLVVEPGNDATWSLTGDFTIEMWIKPSSSSITGNQTLAESFKNIYNYWRIYRTNSNIQFVIRTATDFIQITSSNFTLSNDQWYHIAVCRSRSRIKLFINGSQAGSTISNNLYPSLGQNDYLFIGASLDFNNTLGGDAKEGFNGYIDEFILTNAAKYRFNFIPSQYTQEYSC
jgi:hypothetical protein